MEQKNQIIYSAKVMTQLVELGFTPIFTMKNPKYPQFDCWVFKRTSKFLEALNKVLGGIRDGR